MRSSHKDINKVWDMYEKTQTEPGERTYSQFAMALTFVLDKFLHSDATLEKTELAQLWILRAELHLGESVLPYLSMASIAKFLAMVKTPGVLDTLFENPSNHNMLACAFLQAVCTQPDSVPETAKNIAIPLLTTWLSPKIDIPTLTSPSSACDLLYGPGVWDLYRTDVQDDNYMAAHLYKAGVAPTGLLMAVQSNPGAIGTTALPRDIV